MVKKLAKTVFVGISGGVDSSVSAALLKEQGYNVVGVFIRTWQPDFIECTWRTERMDAMRVCAHLDIPFLECDAEEVYKNNVANYMIEEYKKGNTPNPDVMCNRKVKFGVFWDFAKARKADYIATGHYAQVDLLRANSEDSENSNIFRKATGVGVPQRAKRTERDKELGEKLFELKRGNDIAKDQSYFLWTLTQDDLSHILFPIGHLKKSQVRKLAEKYKLPTATKKDSQGVCFLGPLDMKDFLAHYIKPKRGDVLDENGKIIGYHDGSVFFTLGERHGFTITKKSPHDQAYFIVSKDIRKNIIVVSSPRGDVSSGPQVGSPDHSETSPLGYALKNTNWILSLPNSAIAETPNKEKTYTAQIRYHGDQLRCKIIIENYNKTLISFVQPTIVSPGQSIVIYDKDVCIGGGVVI